MYSHVQIVYHLLAFSGLLVIREELNLSYSKIAHVMY